MNYLVAPRNYDRDFGGRTPGFGDMDEYGLPRDMSPEDKREVLDRFPLPGERGGVDTRGPSITPGSNPMGVSTEMRGLDEFKKGLDEVNRFMGIYEMLDQRGKEEVLKDLLLRPTDTFDIRNPVYRPEDKVEVQPLAPETGKRDFLYQYLEQNKEVIGPRTQMFDRFADPDDGTLTAGMPRYIRGHQYAPRGVIMTVPDIDSRFMNERIKRGFVPMTPPPRPAAGPQLPGFV